MSHLALESTTPLNITFALFKGHSMVNVFKVSEYLWYTYTCISQLKATLPQNALKRDCNGKCIELIEGHYLEVVVLLYQYETIY